VIIPNVESYAARLTGTAANPTPTMQQALVKPNSWQASEPWRPKQLSHIHHGVLAFLAGRN
jgi:hypothetical protein